VDADKITYVDAGLVYGVTYYYRVRAVDNKNNQSGWSSTVSAFPVEADAEAPSSPSGIAAYGLGADGLGGARIYWTPNFQGDLAGYNIHRSTSAGFAPAFSNKLNITLISPTAEPYWEDSSAAVSGQYYYKVVAFDDSANSSDPSDELVVKIVPVEFNIDAGFSPSAIRILGGTHPLSWETGLPMAFSAASTYTVTLGFNAGTELRYLYAATYGGATVDEGLLNTASGNRQYTVPSSSSSLYDDWKENPPVADGLKVYSGANKAYIFWDEIRNVEDLAGYNIYRSVPPSAAPTLKLNGSPVAYSQPYTAEDLSGGVTYYFSVKAVDGGSKVLESTAAVTAGVRVSSAIYVSFGAPYAPGDGSLPWGDPSRVKMYLAVKTSTDVSVWSSSDRADATGGLMEMTASGSGEYRATLPLALGQYYNFLFWARATDNPPAGLSANTEYYDTVPSTGSFGISTASHTISPPAGAEAVFAPVGESRDARRLLYIPPSLTAGSTIYVFANFGSTPTAPSYIQISAGNAQNTLYWSAPYGAPWTRMVGNVPIGGGESMKAADVAAGGSYRIYVATGPTDPGNFANYSLLADVPGSSFTYTHAGLANGVTYYYLMRAYDGFSGLSGNNYGALSSTVSAAPTAAHVVARIRVNRGAADVWKSVRKTIAFQEGTVVPAWDAEGRSNMTPGGTAVNMTAPDDDPSEQEFSVTLSPGSTYNFLLFAYSTFSINGLVTNATYYDTVPASGSGGMVTSTSTLSVTGHGSARCGPVGPSWDARRLLYIPPSLASGSTLYVYCNFASSPSAAYVTASVASTSSVHIAWTPYGAWGTGGEALKAVDVIAGGFYRIWRSSVSSSGPWNLWLSTTATSWTDTGRYDPVDGLGLEAGRTYYYVAASSDAYGAGFIPNMHRVGAPEFSSADASVTPRQKTPTYFKVEAQPFDGFDEKYVCAVYIARKEDE
jgi:hypothetical protein